MDGIIMISYRMVKITVKLLRIGMRYNQLMSSMMIVDIIYEKLFSCVIFEARN